MWTLNCGSGSGTGTLLFPFLFPFPEIGLVFGSGHEPATSAGGEEVRYEAGTSAGSSVNPGRGEENAGEKGTGISESMLPASRRMYASFLGSELELELDRKAGCWFNLLRWYAGCCDMLEEAE